MTIDNLRFDSYNLLIFVAIFIALAAIFSFGMGNVSAATPGDTIYVNSSGGNDYNNGSSWLYAKQSIGKAVGAVNNNGTIYLANGQYSGTGNTAIIISQNMIINGESQNNTIINGSQSGQSIFMIENGVNVTINDLSLKNNMENNGVIDNEGGNLTLNNITFTNNRAFFESYAGTIFSYGTLTINNSTFANNTADSEEGGNIDNSGTLIISNSTFTNNNNVVGGTIYNYNNATVNSCNFINNTSDDGGAIDNNGGTLTVSSSTFLNNSAYYGGAVFNYEGIVNIHFSRITGNIGSETTGHTIYNSGGTVNASLNWWGSNSGPSTTDLYGTVTTGPWLVLTVNSSPNFILNNGTSTITADLLHDSNGTVYDPNNGHVPDGIPITFITTLGSIISPLNTTNGALQSTLNIGSNLFGNPNILVSLDNQTVITQVLLINNIPTTASANLKSGLYNSILSLVLSMNKPGTIYYTTDGSTPTFNSNRYTSNLILSKTTTLKFFGMDLAGNTSPVYTYNYIIDTIPPKVISTNPKNLSTNISRTATITIKFSETFKTSTNWSKIYVKDLNTGKLITISKIITGSTLTIKTDTKSADNWYQIYIPGAAVKDNAGNNNTLTTFKYKTN